MIRAYYSFIPLVFLASLVNASWFSSSPEYAKWSDSQLRTWLDQHNIKVPASFDKSLLHDLVGANWKSAPALFSAYADAGRQWSFDQFNKAQHAFEHIKDDSFDKWDEGKLRTFLLEQGIVAPTGPREQLVILAKQKYRAYTDAAEFYSSLASSSASSLYSSATDTADYASQCISSAVTQATQEVTRAIDDSKDYVYSTWDDSHLRSWLEDHGVVEAKSASTRSELMRLAKDYYDRTAFAIWESWNDSYMREWLIAHNLLRPTETLSRANLVAEMKKYYYSCADRVWNTWSDSELKVWLLDHGLLKSEAKKNRDELIKTVQEHYPSASDSIWGAWSDSDIRQWLSEHGYIDKGDAHDRKSLVDLINQMYSDGSTNVASYLTWPDARLRAYLRERGVSDKALPTSRPGLLQETRIRWVQAANRGETVFTRLKEIISNSVEAAEEKAAHIIENLSGHLRHGCEQQAKEGTADEL